MIPWLVVLFYIVPIVGTLVTMRRRVRSLWHFGEAIRRLFPDDRYYRKIRELLARWRAWRDRTPLSRYANIQALNLLAGKIEYAFGHLRDYTVGVYMMFRFVSVLTPMVFGDPVLRATRFPSLFYYGFFSLLSLWTYRRHVVTGLHMTEFMRVNPHVPPEEFFDHYYRRLGPATTPVPDRAIRTIDPTDVSFLTGHPPRKSFGKLLHGVYDTAIFARSAYKALEAIGPEYGREVFDVMSSLWGARILQLFRSRMVVRGIEKFRTLGGKIILVFNHKSHLDYVFNFCALSSARLASGRKVRPRYMAAKDHFVDNKFVYTGLGIGKLIETVDMVFVDRKGKGRLAIDEAANKLVEKEIEVAMYPQGTRALANYTPEGARRDAGYYTTGTATSLKEELGHIKKGCAYLALNSAKALRPQGVPVHLVFIGIDGTATLASKDSFSIQTEGTVRFTVGDILTVAEDDTVESLTDKIDRGLVGALGLHETLRGRFIEDLRRLALKENILSVNHRLVQAAREGQRLPFVVIDRTYALPPEEQSPFLRELARRLAAYEPLETLRDKVTDQLFRARGKELKRITRQEKARKAV